MNISSKYIFTLMLIFIRGEIEIPNNFVKICGAEPSPKHRHTNSKIVPFHRNLRTSPSFDPMRHWSMDPSRQICRSNRPPVLITLNERPSILKWRKGTNWLHIFRLIAYLFFTIRNKLTQSLLEQVEFSLFSPSSTCNSKSTRAICFLFIPIKFRFSLLKRFLDEWCSVAFYHWQNILV